MKILVVCDEWPWPPHQGDRVRLEAIVRILAEKHEVTVLGRPSELRPVNVTGNLRTMALQVSKNRLKLLKHPGLPAAVALRISTSVQERVVSEAKAHDRVLFYQMKTTAWITPRLEVSKVVVDLTDSLGLYYARRGGAIWRAESARTFRWERHLAEKYSVTVSSEHDRQAIDPKGRLRVMIAANGYWLPDHVERHPEPNALIAVGNWNYFPNRTGLLHFVHQIWPQIIEACPDARLLVVGRGENPMPGSAVGVEWVGEVNNLAPWYGRASLAIAPIYVGAGMKTKIMEALFYGVPVVASQFATEGIDSNSLLVSSINDQDMAKKILQALDRGLRWQEEERVQFLENHSWGHTLMPLIHLLEQGDLR